MVHGSSRIEILPNECDTGYRGREVIITKNLGNYLKEGEK